MGHFVARVHRVQRVQKGKVLKMDGPSAQGFLSLTALWAEGCGIALWAMSIKSALRDWLFCVIGLEKHSADWLAALAPPIRLRRTAPASGGRIGFYAFLQRHSSISKHP